MSISAVKTALLLTENKWAEVGRRLKPLSTALDHLDELVCEFDSFNGTDAANIRNALVAVKAAQKHFEQKGDS